MFSKYGDAALEKLIPKRETKAEYSKALKQANGEIRLLEKEKREDEAETAREKKAVKKIAATLRSEAKSGVKKAGGSGEVERVEEGVEEGVERRERETKEADRKGSKVATEISEVPAVGSRATKLMTLRETIKRMQEDDQSDDKVMRHELAAVQSQV